MELVVLGSGAFAPARDPRRVRNPSGYAVRLGRELILFDLGFGNLRQLARAGLDPAEITTVFTSHRHPDHCGDLPALLFFLRYERPPRRGDLTLFGPQGFARFVGGLQGIWKPWLGPRDYDLRIREVKSGELIVANGWRVTTLAVPHPTPALAFRLESKGRSFVYSGDTGYSDALARFASGCDLFLLECTVSDREPLPAQHLTVSEALKLVKASGCRRAVLTHLSPESEAALSRRRLGPRVRLARDLLRVRMVR